MNFQQNEAVNIAIEGHNLLILGAAGTGKSFTITTIKDKLQSYGKQVKITCSTGIACTVFEDACTIHRFLGLKDGRYGPDEIIAIHKNAAYQFVQTNLNNTDCLIVDECSMISKRTFETLCSICSTKKFKAPIQLIFCGDFYQLPPVPNERYLDSGEYCFDSPHFNKLFPHKVVLCDNFRTRDITLANAISNIFSGNLTSATEEFILSLKRPLSDCHGSVKLFSNNRLVNDYNRSCLLTFPGEIFEHVSIDSGEKYLLDKSTAPRVLWLKVNCPVILLQNLSDKLFNGQRGIVHSITNDGIVIKFSSVEITTKIPIVKFTVFDPSRGIDIAIREQYPLQPGFALTIHKAQGMTLDSVEINCLDIFKPGQLGVALSRATTSSGVRVINFHPRYVMKPPKSVADFMMLPNRGIVDDLSCCRSSCQGGDTSKMVNTQQESVDSCNFFIGTSTPGMGKEHQESKEEYSSLDHEDFAGQEEELEEMFDVDDDFDSILKELEKDEENLRRSKLPDGLFDELMSTIFTKNEITPFQINMNEIVSRIEIPKLVSFVKKILLKMNELIKYVTDKDEPITKGIPEKKLNTFYNHVHEYSIGPEYKIYCMFLFESEPMVTDEHLVICYKVLEAVRVFCLKQKVDLIQAPSLRVSHRIVTDSSKARIRYVAGYCVAKLRNKYFKQQMSNMYSKTREGQSSYVDSKSKLSVLNFLKEDEQFLMDNSSHPDSLIDTAQKQGIKRGLTNVTDSFYSFFLALTNTSLKLVVQDNLMKYGKGLFAYSVESLINDNQLYELFSTLVESKLVLEQIEEFDEICFSDSSNIFTYVKIIFEELTEKYVSVLLAQFRRDMKSACKIEKKMAHRHQIKVSSSKIQTSDCNGPKKRKVSESVKPVATMSEEHQVSIPSAFTEHSLCIPQSESSYLIQQLDENNNHKCKKCNIETADEFIHCHTCKSWYHRKCAGLKNARTWNKYMKPNSQWVCKLCS